MYPDRKSAKMLPYLLDFCFKQGVVDAYKKGNEYLCREFVAERREKGDFALLDDDKYVLPWREWRFVLTTWCRYTRQFYLAHSYLDKITQINYAWAVLPICMDFYLMGVEEWLEYPCSANIETFKSTRKIHWKLGTPKHDMTRDDLFSYAQAFAYKRIRADKEHERKNVPSQMAYETFTRAIWSLTRPLPKRAGHEPIRGYSKVVTVDRYL